MEFEIDNERHLAVADTVISDFQDELESVAENRIHILPDLKQFINHQGRFSRPNIKLRPGIFINQRLLADESQSDIDRPSHLTFNVQPGHRLGRENSHNKVFFGKLRTHRGYVELMDTVDWQEMDLDERFVQLGFAIDTAVLLHSQMLFHGDLEFKNVGFGETGELVIVDPELMVSAADLANTYLTSQDEATRERAILRISQIMSNDFSAICRSIDSFIFKGLPADERPKSGAALFKVQKRHLFNPYKEKILSSNSQYATTLIKAYDRMLHDRKVRAHE